MQLQQAPLLCAFGDAAQGHPVTLLHSLGTLGSWGLGFTLQLLNLKNPSSHKGAKQ